MPDVTVSVPIRITMSMRADTKEAVERLSVVANMGVLTRILQAAVTASIVADIVERFKRYLPSRKVEFISGKSQTAASRADRSAEDLLANTKFPLGRVLAVLSAAPVRYEKGVRAVSIADLDTILTREKYGPGADYPGSMTSEQTPNRLWRQLEFGTGIYAKAGQRLAGQTKNVPGFPAAWRLKSTIIKGEQPGNFLVDKQLQHYDDERLKALREWFGRYFAQALRSGTIPGEG